ncbi:MAG TPA: sigma-70 family RNA polymerase sigma factor [Gemmataceae bacterium]|jgi:RNA polymerase sigma-70 factor (ECF subfamily)|nr:sigma-70 family RNA polymerase sigma factor [Gemmataceae bacterium]
MTHASNTDGSSTRTPRSLIERARANDPAAWTGLVDLYAPLAHRWCRRSGLGDADTADVLQDVFLAVAAHLNGFKKERSGDTFRGWLRVILRNKVHDHFRRLGREPGGEGGTEAQLRFAGLADPEPLEETGTDNAERLLLRKCCDLIRTEFHDRTWQAFWATAVEGRPAPDVAVELGMSPVGVRVSKSRVLQRLREALGDLG